MFNSDVWNKKQKISQFRRFSGAGAESEKHSRYNLRKMLEFLAVF